MLIWKAPIRIMESDSWLGPDNLNNLIMCLRALPKLSEFRPAWCCDHHPVEPVPMLNHPLNENPIKYMLRTEK